MLASAQFLRASQMGVSQDLGVEPGSDHDEERVCPSSTLMRGSGPQQARWAVPPRIDGRYGILASAGF